MYMIFVPIFRELYAHKTGVSMFGLDNNWKKQGKPTANSVMAPSVL